jgi:hypothetical protein
MRSRPPAHLLPVTASDEVPPASAPPTGYSERRGPTRQRSWYRLQRVIDSVPPASAPHTGYTERRGPTRQCSAARTGYSEILIRQDFRPSAGRRAALSDRSDWGRGPAELVADGADTPVVFGCVAVDTGGCLGC